LEALGTLRVVAARFVERIGLMVSKEDRHPYAEITCRFALSAPH
jgi:hypothetical protein